MPDWRHRPSETRIARRRQMLPNNQRHRVDLHHPVAHRRRPGVPGPEAQATGNQGGDGGPHKRAREGGVTTPMEAPPGLAAQGEAAPRSGPSPPVAGNDQKRAAEDELDDENRCLKTGVPSEGPDAGRVDEATQMAIEKGRDQALAAPQAAAPPPGLEGRVPDEGEQQHANGGHGSCAGEFVDNMSVEWLDGDLVRVDGKLEIDIIHQMWVWRVVQRHEDAHVSGTRWVDVDKGVKTGPSGSTGGRGVSSRGRIRWLRVLCGCAAPGGAPSDGANPRSVASSSIDRGWLDRARMP